ncbi:MAG: hypothetical protein N2C14_07155, partial [Planctomycetales bacterium]
MAEEKSVEARLDELEDQINTRFYISMLGIVATLFATILVWYISNTYTTKFLGVHAVTIQKLIHVEDHLEKKGDFKAMDLE